MLVEASADPLTSAVMASLPPLRPESLTSRPSSLNHPFCWAMYSGMFPVDPGAVIAIVTELFSGPEPEEPDDDDDEPEAIPPPEQADVDAIHAELEEVRDHDRWPKQLHWGDV